MKVEHKDNHYIAKYKDTEGHGTTFAQAIEACITRLMYYTA